MLKNAVYTTTRSFRCAKHLAEKLDRLAKGTNSNASDIVRDAIARYVPAMKTGSKIQKQ